MRITVNAVPSGSVSVSSGSSSNVLVEQTQTGTVSALPGDRSPASIVVQTIAGLSTNDVTEGDNLYFSNARAISAFSAGQSITLDANGRINSTATGGGSSYTDSNTYANVGLIGYATNANVALKSNIADLTTSNVTEVTNLYFTNARSRLALSVSGAGSYDNTTGVITISTYGDANVYSNVVLLGYTTNANLALKANIVDLTTANVTELTNQYFTNARAVSAVVNTTLSNITVSGDVVTTGTGGNLTMTGGYITGANGIVAAGTTFSLVNSAITTVNFAGAATTLTMGAATGNTTVNNSLYVTGNLYNVSTSNITESTNLYFTNARSYANVTALGYITSSALTGYATNTQLASYATNSQLATYATNAQLASYATNAQLTSYATTTNVALKANIVDLTTANVTEVTNLYFTNARAIAAVTASSISVAGGVTANAATAFTAGDAAISGVALAIPREGGIRNSYNGLNSMYFDVSTGGTTNGQFQFRSGSTFTNVLTMSPTAFSVSTDAVVTSRTPGLGRLAWNSALDTELTVDDYRFRVTNSGGIYTQVISNTGGTKNSAWTAVAAISGSAVTQGGSTGVLLPNNSWTTLYTFGSMASAGDTVTVTFQDKAQGRIYRITFMRSDNGSTTGYNIIAERIL